MLYFKLSEIVILNKSFDFALVGHNTYTTSFSLLKQLFAHTNTTTN